MSQQVVDVSAWSQAEPSAVFALLAHGTTWPEWSPLGSFELEREGDDGRREGVGAILVFRTGRVTSREQIVERVHENRLAYVLLTGLPLRDYRAAIDLRPSTAAPRSAGGRRSPQNYPAPGGCSAAG